MRIALVAPPWVAVPPPGYGGTEEVVDTLARGLAAAGHEVVLAATGDSTCPVERVWTYPRGMGDRLGDVRVELRHVLHAYASLPEVDIVHDHTVAGPVLGALHTDRRVVTTNHWLFDDDLRAIYGAIATRVPVVAISQSHAASAPDVPIARVIPHGIDLARYEVGHGKGGYLAFLGRMSPTKGVIEAIAVARATGWPLRIAAKMREPDEREFFAARVAPLLGGDVQYVGVVAGAEKVALLGGAAALLNPIQWDEPFGLCMVEAMACGTPVVATPRGSVPEIVVDGVTGFVRPTVAGLVDAVRRVPSLDRLACRRRVAARFSAARMVADHLALYGDTLADADPETARHAA
jgi:glycosyltransferase involved in cell wall biosynthesis